MSALYKTVSAEKKEDSKEKHAQKNRQRVLVISSRGVTHRHRHLIGDIVAMMPHARKEPKFDSKSKLYQLNEVAEMYNCNNIFYFEARKHMDLYLWMSKAPNGPTAKFHVQNIHTLDELNFTGNCLKGSRPILSFDQTFEDTPHNRLIKEMFLHTLGVPPKARKSKPFTDHVLTLSIVDNKIWFRNYQISETEEGEGKETEMSLVEIGPRFVMTLITILDGSFGGPVIYENKEFVSPNVVRAQIKAKAAAAAKARSDAALKRRIKQQEIALGPDPLSNKAVFN
jgi:ribosome biogenesis protein BRX1